MRLFSYCALVFALLMTAFSVSADDVWVIEIRGGIGPATSDYVAREIEDAREGQASFIVLKMDTPGGLDTSMRDIIRAVTTSSIPVATWVGPSGARAASAGTYILLASHVAAMAPGTNLGAATPVSLTAPGGKDQDEGSNPFAAKQEKEDQGENAGEATGEETDEAKPENERVRAKTAMEKKKSSMMQQLIFKGWLSFMVEMKNGQRKR